MIHVLKSADRAISDYGDVAIRRTALDRGLVDEDHVGQMSRREVWNLMFLPGFSTRREVTSLSGRGVGLDERLLQRSA